MVHRRAAVLRAALLHRAPGRAAPQPRGAAAQARAGRDEGVTEATWDAGEERYHLREALTLRFCVESGRRSSQLLRRNEGGHGDREFQDGRQRYVEDFRAVVAAVPAGAWRARPTCCWWCWTTWGSRSSAASGPTSPRRPSTGSPRVACATRTSTPPLCSPTRARLLTGRNHHTCGMGRWPSWPPASRGTTRASSSSCGFLAAHAHRPRVRGATRSGSGTTPTRTCTWGAGDSLAARPGLRALVRVPRRRDESVRPDALPRQPLVSPPKSAADGYHLSEDLADRAIEFLTDLRHADLDKPWSTHQDRRLPSAAPRPGRVDRALRALRRRLGRGQAGAAGPPDRARSAAGGHRPVTAARMGAGLGLAVGADLLRLRPLHGGVRRLPVARRRAGRSGDRPASRSRPLRRHRGARAVGQRGVVLRAAEGFAQRRLHVERAAPQRGRGGRADRRDRRPRIHNNYLWKWTVVGNTPFKRWKRRPTRAGWPHR